MLTFAGDVLLVVLDGGDEGFADGDVVLEVEVVEDGAEGEGLGFLEEGEALEVLTSILVLAQLGEGLEEGLEEALLGSARSYYICSDAVDAGVEVVETDVGAVEGIGADELLEEVQRLVVHDCHVVAVPTDGT